MTKATNIIGALLVGFMAFVAIGGSANAGIIVTVGKPMPEDQGRRTAATKGTAMPIYLMAGDGSSNTERTALSACYIDKVGITVCNQKIDPFTGMPADWNCVPIGNGQLYCEGPGIGVGPGTGGDGYFDPSYDEGGFEQDDVDTEIQAVGCAAGMGAGGGIMAVLTLVSMVVFLIRGRRR